MAPSKYEEKIAFLELEGKSFEQAVSMTMPVEGPKKKKTKKKATNKSQ